MCVCVCVCVCVCGKVGWLGGCWCGEVVGAAKCVNIQYMLGDIWYSKLCEKDIDLYVTEKNNQIYLFFYCSLKF